MITKGNARGGGQQLAAHLMNAVDNDRAELHDLRGAIAPDLSGAFAEWQAQSRLTNCRKYLYSLSLNPDRRQGDFTRDQYYDFIARAEKHLGLAGQPRAVVVHVKHGREHFHVVWSRIDTENGRAVQLSHDRQKLRKAAQEFARVHGIELPAGMRQDKGHARFEDRKSRVDLHEKQQEERTGFSKTERVRVVTAAWAASATADEFRQKLLGGDLLLAHGDRRGYVVVDLAGEVHSLSRQIKGIRSGELAGFLAELPADSVPNVAAAQMSAREMRDRRSRKPAQTGPTPDERRQQLEGSQRLRRLAVELERDEMHRRHATERAHLSALQAEQSAAATIARAAGKPGGVLGFLRRITGIQYFSDLRHNAATREREREQRRQAEALDLRHHNEAFEYERACRALDRLDGRERLALETTLRREEFQRIAGPGTAAEKEKTKGKHKAPRLTIERGGLNSAPARPASVLRQAFNRIAAGQQRMAESRRAPERADKGRPPESLRAVFAPVAEAALPQKNMELSVDENLSALFTRAASGQEDAPLIEADPAASAPQKISPPDRVTRR